MKSQYYESASQIVKGKALFTDDIPPFHNELKAYIYTSPVSHGLLKSYDLTKALKVQGIVKILTHKDIPGIKKFGVTTHDQPILVIDEINFFAEPLFLIIAHTYESAYQAAKLIKVEIQELEPVISIEQAKKKDWKLASGKKLEQGNIDIGFKQSDHIIQGQLHIGGQEHWYLETHVSIALPGEEKEIKVYSSTQNPTENQHLIAKALNIPFNEVEVEVRRLGGAFGGKEAQASHFAILAALAAYHTKQPVRLRLQRFQDQLITGKRHEYICTYKVGFDKNGKILAADLQFDGNAGAYTDLSLPILERTLFHAENAYYIPSFRVIGTMWRTSLPPNTAFRGFGGPQGIASIENILHEIAYKLHKDPTEIKKINFYTDNNNQTPYGQKVLNNSLHILYEQLMEKIQYKKRKEQIEQFNNTHKFLKRSLALIPIKFGISFTNTILNQAGALVHVYTDGTVRISHAGVEMGQGLYTKIQSIAAKEFGISTDRIKITPTSTDKVPNTVPTAASTGTDLNGMAVADAIELIKLRMTVALSKYFNEKDKSHQSLPADLVFENNFIYDKNCPNRRISFSDAAKLMFVKRINLSATGYYRTPNIFMDWNKGKGQPFYYYSFGMGTVEIELDLLTGKVKLIRADLFHDVGNSINENIDIGQIQGAFIQGTGWTLLEDLRYSSDGKLLNRTPDTYKIPAITDIPKEFNVYLLKGYLNKGTIHNSKAIGEPPFMYGIAPWLAVKDIIASLSNYKNIPQIDLPATNDKIVVWVENALNNNNL